VIDGEHVARLEPLGLTFEPALLPLSTSARAMAVLDESTGVVDGDSMPLVGPEEIAQTVAHETEFAELDLETDDGAESARPRLPEVLVRVVGPPDVPAFPALGRMDLNVVAFLACAGGSTTVDQVTDAVWGGRLVEKETVWNRMSKVRAVVGDLLPRREQGSSAVTLDGCVGTDVGYFAAVLDYSNQVSTTEAIETLTEALQLVRGVPFDAAGYDWAHQRQHFTRACELVEAAGLRLAEIALDVGDVATARFAVSQALRALPANEPLYRCRMQIEAAANNLQGVRSAYNELLITLDDWGDGLDAEPSPTTADLFVELTRRTDERSAS
jgi:DNA-binding SARP family transcriptional activator